MLALTLARSGMHFCGSCSACFLSLSGYSLETADITLRVAFLCDSCLLPKLFRHARGLEPRLHQHDEHSPCMLGASSRGWGKTQVWGGPDGRSQFFAKKLAAKKAGKEGGGVVQNLGALDQPRQARTGWATGLSRGQAAHCICSPFTAAWARSFLIAGPIAQSVFLVHVGNA